MGRCVYSTVNSPPNNKFTTFSRKLMLGKTLDGEFKLLRIRELDNDDVDVLSLTLQMKIHLQT